MFLQAPPASLCRGGVSLNISDRASCFFCHSARQRNLILVSEDALGNPEYPDGLGTNATSKAIRYHDDYKKQRRIYWVCRRCFYLHPSDCRRYRDIREKKEAVALVRVG